MFQPSAEAPRPQDFPGRAPPLPVAWASVSLRRRLPWWTPSCRPGRSGLTGTRAAPARPRRRWRWRFRGRSRPGVDRPAGHSGLKTAESAPGFRPGLSAAPPLATAIPPVLASAGPVDVGGVIEAAPWPASAGRGPPPPLVIEGQPPAHCTWSTWPAEGPPPPW